MVNRPLDLETRVELLWDSPHGPDMHVAASAGVLESIRAVRGELFGKTVVYELKDYYSGHGASRGVGSVH